MKPTNTCLDEIEEDEDDEATNEVLNINGESNYNNANNNVVVNEGLLLRERVQSEILANYNID